MVAEETFPERAARYRRIAETLRRMADEVKYNFRYRDQLLSLAAGFDRAAERLDANAI